MVDQDRSDGRGCHGVEVAAVLPVDLLLTVQALVGLVDKLGWLQGACAGKARQLPLGEFAQDRVERGHEGGGSAGFARAPRVKQRGD